MKTLVAWDIDGTLVRTSRAARSSFSAFEVAARACGVTGPQLAPTDGKTDMGILAELVGDQLLADALEAFDAAWPAHVAAETYEALPGVDRALAATRSVGAHNVCVTGNVPARARAKLSRVGLDSHIDFGGGAYGNLSTERADLVRAVVRPGVRVIIVGDTPADMHAALVGGATAAVAVCTGLFDHRALDDSGAHLVISDLVTGLAALLALVEDA